VIVVDTSVIIAVIAKEPEAGAFIQIMTDTRKLWAPASCLLEASIALRRKFRSSSALDGFVGSFRVGVSAIDSIVAQLARAADAQYGRATGHPARLNFGDCLSYAVAKHLNAPLLFKGDDFIHTDIESALAA
jgi:ribonuclease VapC